MLFPFLCGRTVSSFLHKPQMARTYTQVEVDELLQAQEERFNAERVFLNRLVDMHAHKNAQYQKVVTTMSADIIKKNKQIGQADGEIIALRPAAVHCRSLALAQGRQRPQTSMC